MEEVVAHLFSLIFHSFHPSEADYLVSEQFRFYGIRPSTDYTALYPWRQKPHNHCCEILKPYISSTFALSFYLRNGRELRV
jgi:hypothetical protein